MRVEFSFGIGVNRHGEVIDQSTAAEAVRHIRIQACRMFGGCSVASVEGAWQSPNGEIILEESRVVTCDVDCVGRTGGGFNTVEVAEKVDRLAQFISTILSQSCVHVTKIVATSRNVLQVEMATL